VTATPQQLAQRIGGVGVLTPETAQAAGVVVDRHQAYGVTTTKVPPVRERDED
jgi:hypothetical protein